MFSALFGLIVAFLPTAVAVVCWALGADFVDDRFWGWVFVAQVLWVLVSSFLGSLAGGRGAVDPGFDAHGVGFRGHLSEVNKFEDGRYPEFKGPDPPGL